MTNTTKSKDSGIIPPEPITEFEVSEYGTLRMSGFADAETRAQFYDYIADWWDESPSDLAAAMDECEPLAWEVQSIYSNFRDQLQAEIEEAEDKQEPDSKKIDALKARLAAMPEEPEDGAKDWLLKVDNGYFKSNIVERIRNWYAEPPNWGWEDDYLPVKATGQGAAFEYFQDMDQESLDLLGVEVIEGDVPGSSYFAAELHCDIEEANAAAEAAGLPERFVAQKG